MGNKNTEQDCLNIVMECSTVGNFAKSIKQLLSDDYIQEERPDFLSGNGLVGLEHFLVDVIFGVKHKEAQSIERKNSGNIAKKINFYYENSGELDTDISNGKAQRFVEDIINSEINGVSNFTYISFIKNFRKVFDEHYANRSVYRSKCGKLGFLIELPYPHSLNNYYIVNKNNRIYRQSLKTLPVTTDMLNYIQNHSDLDFVILCIRPIHFSDRNSECKSIYINPKDVYKSVKEQGVFSGVLGSFLQGVFICDSFDYPHKFSSKNVVKLDVKKSGSDSK